MAAGDARLGYFPTTSGAGTMSAGINGISTGVTPGGTSRAWLDSMYNVIDKAKAFTASQKTLGSIYSPTSAPAYAPYLDIAGTNAKARAEAAGAVSPYYQKVLNDYLTQQASFKQQKQAQVETDIKNYEDSLKNTLEGNTLTGERTSQDVATNLADVNTQADQFQTDSGMQNEVTRLALAKTTSTGGLGQQTMATAEKAQNTAESRQEQQFTQARDAQNLFKTRTFEDLAKSGELATINKEKGVKQTQFDLENYMTNLSFDEQNQRNQLEEQKQSRITSEANLYAKKAFNDYIQGIADPAQRVAAYQQYGGSF